MRKRLAAAAVGLVIVGLAAALATIDRWLFVALDPGPFDISETPPAPDSDDPRSWAALPELRDGADVALDELPAVDPSRAGGAVFYLHPTTWLGTAWNAETNAPSVVEATRRGGTEIFADVSRAFAWFLARTDRGPFFIAGHKARHRRRPVP